MEERTMSISDALRSLRPGAQWVAVDGVVTWHDTEQTQPSDAEVQAEVTRLQEEYDAQDYARKRAMEYPSIDELVVALYDTEDKGAIDEKRAAIKAKYPKP